jgi:hypothetical protein
MNKKVHEVKIRSFKRFGEELLTDRAQAHITLRCSILTCWAKTNLQRKEKTGSRLKDLVETRRTGGKSEIPMISKENNTYDGHLFTQPTL